MEFKLSLEKGNEEIIAQGQPLMKCPVCGNYSVVNEGGCYICLVCGWSKCDV